jgi:proline iminopeptidase
MTRSLRESASLNRSHADGRIAVPGGSVWWRRWGSGEGIPLLVIHGGPGLTSHYLEPLAALSDMCPVFTWDQLDCGRSDRPNNPDLWTLERFVEELDDVRAALAPGPVHILGHSWGAMLAMEWLVTTRPVDVASVTFAGPSLDVPRWIQDTRALVGRLSPAAQAAIAEAERTGDFRTPGYHAASWGEWMRAYIVRQLPAEAVDALLASLPEMNANLDMLEYMWGPSEFTVTGALKDFDRTAELRTLTMPVLFHCGEFDEARPETVREQAALTPDAEVAVIAGAAHLTMLDAPEQANDAIRKFLARVESGAPVRAVSATGQPDLPKAAGRTTTAGMTTTVTGR